MKLTTEDTQLFYKLNWSLLFYANQKFNIIPGLTEPNFKKENVDKVVKIHQKIYQDLFHLRKTTAQSSAAILSASSAIA